MLRQFAAPPSVEPWYSWELRLLKFLVHSFKNSQHTFGVYAFDDKAINGHNYAVDDYLFMYLLAYSPLNAVDDTAINRHNYAVDDKAKKRTMPSTIKRQTDIVMPLTIK